MSPPAPELVARACHDGRFTVYLSATRDMQRPIAAPPESGSSALILDCMERGTPHSPLGQKIIAYLKSRVRPDGTMSFFEEPALLPADTEQTSFAVGLLRELGTLDSHTVQQAAEAIAQCQDAAGRVQIYFEPGQRTNHSDHTSALNVLTFMGQLGQSAAVAGTVAWIDEVIAKGTFLEGSRYYHSPDTFLYFAARLITRVPSLGDRWRTPIRQALRRRVGQSAYPLDLSMRVAAQRWLGDAPQEVEALLALRQPDGSWPIDAIYRYGGSRQGYFGSSILSTAFAIQALSAPNKTAGRSASR